MKISTEATLIGSLLGQKVKIPRNEFLQNELGKHVLPVVNLYPAAKDINETIEKVTSKIWPEKDKVGQKDQFFPLTLTKITKEGEQNTTSSDEQKKQQKIDNSFELPFEPIVNITAKNNIIKRNIAKSKGIGTVKERWSRDDYTIDITCVLRNGDINAYPEADFQKLYSFLKVGETLAVKYEPFQLLEIHNIVIEDFSVPYTPGENLQTFTINAVSDNSFELLIKTNKEFHN